MLKMLIIDDTRGRDAASGVRNGREATGRNREVPQGPLTSWSQ